MLGSILCTSSNRPDVAAQGAVWNIMRPHVDSARRRAGIRKQYQQGVRGWGEVLGTQCTAGPGPGSQFSGGKL